MSTSICQSVILLILVLWLVAFQTDVLAESTCVPAEEGQPYSLQCNVPTHLQDTPIAWRNYSSVICTCKNSNSPPCSCSKDFVALLSTENEIYISTFIITTVQRTQEGSEWRCTADFLVLDTCEFKVYTKPKRPTCSTPLFDGKGNITVVCMAQDVYPLASCHFFVQTNGSTQSTQLGPTAETVKPYHTCELDVSEASLKPGSHRFKVGIYPIIDGIEYEPGMAESGFTSPILISPSQCEPAEENQTYTLKCTIKSLPAGNTMVWEDQVDPKCTCTAGISDCVCKVGYRGTLFPSGSGSYVSTFIIIRPDRLQAGTNWTCRHIEAVYSCPFQVFVLPVNPVCESPVLHHNGSLSLTCMADDAYPQAACHFFRKTNDTLIEEIPPTVYIDRSPYSCTLTTLVSHLPHGSHEFEVRMTPVIAGLEYSNAGFSQSNFTSPVIIEAPQAVLAEDCPPSGSFLEINTTVTCTCLRNDSSDLPTFVTWNSTDLSDTSNSSYDVLNFTATSSFTEFTCTAINNIGLSSSVDLILKTAYGPYDLLVTTDGDSTLHLCGTSIEIQAQCQVPEEEVNPAPTFSFTFNQSETTAPLLGHQENTSYTLTKVEHITSGGHFSITCRAANSALMELFAQNSVTLSITEPPSTPVLEVWQNGESVNLSDIVLVENKATINCQAQGGYPSVNGIHLSIGTLNTTLQQVSNISSFVTMTVDITRKMISQQFVCVVNHSSICYENIIRTLPIQISTKPDSDHESGSSLRVILGVVFGVILLVAVSVTVICFCRRRKRQETQETFCLSENTRRLTETDQGHANVNNTYADRSDGYLRPVPVQPTYGSSPPQGLEEDPRRYHDIDETHVKDTYSRQLTKGDVFTVNSTNFTEADQENANIHNINEDGYLQPVPVPPTYRYSPPQATEEDERHYDEIDETQVKDTSSHQPTPGDISSA